MMSYFHSVTLDSDKCQGCTNCIKRCPTEAIRVRRGKAKIIKERCIDCGECIRVCPYHAKLAVTDGFEELERFTYNVALPAPSLYGQFRHTDDINKVLTALLQIGFDDVFEVARGAEVSNAVTRRMLAEDKLKKPAISSACPAVVRLIRERFPNLLAHVIPLLSPMELSAIRARKEAREKTGLPDEEIGVFFITPCPAKVTSIKAPLAIEKSAVSGAISVKDAFVRLLPLVTHMEHPQQLSVAGAGGIAWARNGGESEGIRTPRYIAVDGIHHIIDILEELEGNRLDDVDFIELSACDGGCVGGPLHVANAFVASTRIKNMQAVRPAQSSEFQMDESELFWKREVEANGVMRLDPDLAEAMRKMEQIEELYEQMPKLDCGSCGAPSCKALAEDIVRGFANENDCIIRMRKRIRELAQGLMDPDQP